MKSELDLARALASKAESDLRMAEIGMSRSWSAVAFHVQVNYSLVLESLTAIEVLCLTEERNR